MTARKSPKSPRKHKCAERQVFEFHIIGSIFCVGFIAGIGLRNPGELISLAKYAVRLLAN
jgi:hypothetical protein